MVAQSTHVQRTLVKMQRQINDVFHLARAQAGRAHVVNLQAQHLLRRHLPG
jgi:hypothetical protein